MVGLCLDDDGLKRVIREIATLAVMASCEILEGWGLRGVTWRCRIRFRLANDRFPKRRREGVKRREIVRQRSVNEAAHRSSSYSRIEVSWVDCVHRRVSCGACYEVRHCAKLVNGNRIAEMGRSREGQRLRCI